jgi:bacterioferritin-associated ferredoxin
MFVCNCDEVSHQRASIRIIMATTNAHKYSELSLYAQ